MRPHPSGYPEAIDSPAHIAPALELKRAIEATQSGAVEDAVVYTLSFPIIERVPDEDTSPEIATHPVGEEPDTLVDLPAIDPDRTLERDPYRDGEQTLQATEYEVLTRSLQAIGPIEDPSDSAGKVLLARARAIRFRLALLDTWPEDHSAPRPIEDNLDLAIHPATIVALAGEPVDEHAVVRAIVDDLQKRLPGVTRSTLRDAGAAAFARVTLLGIPKAVDYVRTRFADLPGAERRAAVALAASIAKGREPTLRALRSALGS